MVTILGARKSGSRCWAEVDLDALRENLAWIRHQAGPQVQIITVVKADAYGHGLKTIAGLLMRSGTDVFGVANLVEAQSIRSVGRGWPVLMLGAALPEERELAVVDGIRPTISSLEEGQAFSVLGRRFGKEVRAHLKIDTGMGRLGVPSEQAFELIRQLIELPHLKLDGVYSHFANVEDDPVFSKEQATRFQALMTQVNEAGIQVPMVHTNNSGALLFGQENPYNTVRPGLMVYGIFPPGQRALAEAWKNHLRPALSWKCRVTLVKSVPAGTSLSYGRTFVTPEPMRVATLSAGYGDGYLRAGSNRAQVLIGGRRCRVLGRITMDQMLVDVSALPEVKPGDEVVLIGEQGGQRITANDLAEWCQTIPWEVLTAITYRVPRLYRGGQAA